MLKNIIFDWSGVIKDAFDSHVWVVDKMIKSLGGKGITKEELRKTWDPSYMAFWAQYYPDLGAAKEQELYYKTVLLPDFPQSDAFEGIVELIKSLKVKDIQMVVLTSDPEKIVLPEIEKFGLAGMFKEVIAHIPDKSKVIGEMMARNNFKIEDTVFIGDSSHEVEAGKSAGIKTIAVTWGFCGEEKLKLTMPDYVVNTLEELENILLK